MKTRLVARSLRFLIVSSLLCHCAFAQSQEPSGFVADKIIAKIDNYIILKSELDGAYQNYLSGGGRASTESKCGIFNQMIINKLLVAKAEIDSILVTDLEVDNNTDQRMNMIMQQSGNSPEQLERQYGKTLEQIKLEIRDQIREQMLAGQMQQKITKDVTVTPAEVKKFFGKIPADSLPYYSADVEVAQIVKTAKVNEQQKLATKLKLSTIRQQILDGASFTEMARKYSEDPSVQYNGGEMGYVGRGTMVPQYEATAFRIRIGEISQPFESPYGFHILQLIDRRGNEFNSRHILIAATPSKADLQDAVKFLDSIRQRITTNATTFEQAAKEVSDDLRTKGRGGYFTDEDGGTKISIKELDPVVYFTIDSLKEGSISKPVTYRMDDGKDAVRIIFFKRRLPPHQANLKDDWHRIQSAALAQKRDNIIEKWFSKARQDVFIKLDPEFNGCKIME